MPDILHRVGIKSSSPDNAYRAITTLDGLAGWWTNNTKGEGEDKVGGALQFRFGAGGFDMKVLELQPAKRVLWQVVDGPDEWMGSYRRVRFTGTTGSTFLALPVEQPSPEVVAS